MNIIFSYCKHFVVVVISKLLHIFSVPSSNIVGLGYANVCIGKVFSVF
jgi:hypothetical protein